ncbi:hypothetical protein [Paraburkholderia sp. BR10882]|uniref:hypothetical protein n=1 Tax=unclassified Paraburkholderia TaxID=2615204 RepID=UPI0034CEEFA8
MSASSIPQIRRFNRIVAESIGAIDDHFLGRGRPMGESRLLWEIGVEGADIRTLRARVKAIFRCPLPGQVQVSAFAGFRFCLSRVAAHAVSKIGS